MTFRCFDSLFSTVHRYVSSTEIVKELFQEIYLPSLSSFPTPLKRESLLVQRQSRPKGPGQSLPPQRSEIQTPRPPKI
jgi:hypothetical protein